MLNQLTEAQRNDILEIPELDYCPTLNSEEKASSKQSHPAEDDDILPPFIPMTF